MSTSADQLHQYPQLTPTWWVFHADDLAAAAEEYAHTAAGDDLEKRADLYATIMYFMHSEACGKRGMSQGGKQS